MTACGAVRLLGLYGCILAVLAACAPTPAAPQPPDATVASGAAERPVKSLTIGVTSAVQAFGMAGAGTPVGGWTSVNEVHSQGLITSEVDSRKPIGRLAARVPSFEDGTMRLLPDGAMQVTYRLRPGITWHDGVAFSAQDLAFSYAIESAPGLSQLNRDAVDQMVDVQAADYLTILITFKGPYYLASTLGVELFWPYPEHLLRAPYEKYLATKNPDDFLSIPFWTSGFGDGILRALEELPAGPETRWAGSSGGFDDPRARRLVEVYRRSMTEPEQIEAFRGLTRYVAAELPFLPLYYEADYIGVARE